MSLLVDDIRKKQLCFLGTRLVLVSWFENVLIYNWLRFGFFYFAIHVYLISACFFNFILSGSIFLLLIKDRIQSAKDIDLGICESSHK